MSTFMSQDVKSQLLSAAIASFAPRDELEEKFGDAVLTNIAGKSTESIGNASSNHALAFTQSLSQLKELGVDMESDFAKKWMAVQSDIQASFSKLAAKAAQ